MTKARTVFWLQSVLGAAGVAVIAFAAAVSAHAISLRVGSASALLRACQSFVIPHPGLAAVLVLGLGSVSGAVLWLAARSAIRQHRAHRRFLSRLDVIGPASVGPPGTLLVEDPTPQAFCTGLLTPRIYLSTGAVAALAPDELEAVLAHEHHHARYRDPLRIFFARVLSDSLFFLPALRRLGDGYSAMAEFAADAAAVRHGGNDTRPLAAALLAFESACPAPGVAGIAPARVDQLLGQRPRWQLPLAVMAWSVLLAGGLLVVALRTADATNAKPLDLPLLGAQLCMLVMAVVPVLLGAAALLSSRRLLRRV